MLNFSPQSYAFSSKNKQEHIFPTELLGKINIFPTELRAKSHIFPTELLGKIDTFPTELRFRCKRIASFVEKVFPLHFHYSIISNLS